MTYSISAIFAVVLLLCFKEPAPIQGFHARSVPPPFRAARLATRTRLYQSSEASSSSTTEGTMMVVTRRDVLAASLSSVLVVTAAVGTRQSTHHDSTPTPIAVNSHSKSNMDTQQCTFLSTVDDALTLIDSQGDKRFLHAVVASGYRLLYVPVHTQTNIVSTVMSVPSSSINQQKPESSDFMAALEQMQDISVDTTKATTATGPFHLVVTNPQAVSSFSSSSSPTAAFSFWPLGDNVHFAWLEQEEAVFLAPHGSGGGSSSFLASRSSTTANLIVDGVDCGVMSLEDALEQSDAGRQVMVHANSFLLVARSMEQDLVAKLKDSFLI